VSSQIPAEVASVGARALSSAASVVARARCSEKIEAGVAEAANTFRLVENSKELLKVTDAAGLAPAGANNRRAGFGTIAPNQKARPGVVAAFAAFKR
jgi:hypothetical protein